MTPRSWRRYRGGTGQDPGGVLRCFAEHYNDATCTSCSPARRIEAVADDPEGREVLAEVEERLDELPNEIGERVHMACLPMEDVEEGERGDRERDPAPLQRRGPKSIAEGFGLTVAEAMRTRTPGCRYGNRPDPGSRSSARQERDPDRRSARPRRVQQGDHAPDGGSRAGAADRGGGAGADQGRVPRHPPPDPVPAAARSAAQRRGDKHQAADPIAERASGLEHPRSAALPPRAAAPRRGLVEIATRSAAGSSSSGSNSSSWRSTTVRSASETTPASSSRKRARSRRRVGRGAALGEQDWESLTLEPGAERIPVGATAEGRVDDDAAAALQLLRDQPSQLAVGAAVELVAVVLGGARYVGAARPGACDDVRVDGSSPTPPRRGPRGGSCRSPRPRR